MKNKNLSDHDSIHIEVSLPNTLTPYQLTVLEELSKPYGGVVVSDEKITFPSLPQDEDTLGIDLCYLTTELVEKAKNTNSGFQHEESENPHPFPSREIIDNLRRQYPRNCRIVLDKMTDPHAPAVGEQAICFGVDDGGNILCQWDSGSSLNIAYGADQCHVVSTEQEAEVSLDYFGAHWRWGLRCPRCGKETEEPSLYALSRRANIQICDRCGIEEALESIKAKRDIGQVYDEIPGVKNRLDWAILDSSWDKL